MADAGLCTLGNSIVNEIVLGSIKTYPSIFGFQ